MSLWCVLAVVIGLPRVPSSTVFGPRAGNDLMEVNFAECVAGAFVKDIHFIDETLTLLSRVKNASLGIRRTTEEVIRDWHDLQRNTANIVQTTDRSAMRMHEISPPAVLVVQAVKGTAPTSDRVRKNMQALRANKYGNFRWAFFFYTNPGEFNAQEWYRNSRDIVIKDTIPGGGCKSEHIRRVSVVDVQEYDYVWLMDDDIDVTFLDWELYATMLVSGQPLVSQPSILAGGLSNRASDIEGLSMEQVSTSGELLIAAERPQSEVMAPVISTKLWPAIQSRAAWKVTKCDSDINTFWDIAAFLGRIYCNISAILVVNSAPVSHMDCHTMPFVHECFTGCDPDMMKPISSEEAFLMQAACPGIPDDWVSRWGCDRVNLLACLDGLKKNAYSQPRQVTVTINDTVVNGAESDEETAPMPTSN